MHAVLLFLNMGLGEILLIMVFILMFFGTKSIPDIARTAGKAMRQIRDASDELKREIKESAQNISREAGIDKLEENSDIKEIREALKPDQNLEN